MTEAEWLACQDSEAMLLSLRGKAKPRKPRLFGVLCCGRQWDAFRDDRNREAIRVGEQLADGQAPEPERANAEARLADLREQLEERDDYDSLIVPYALLARTFTVDDAVRCSTEMADGDSYDLDSFEGIANELRSEQADYLRDIFGNPFRRVAFDPRCRTADVVALARGIYDDRAFDRLPLLADALMDAGCADEALLAHCRSAGPHVRGCWLVDLILGKE